MLLTNPLRQTLLELHNQANAQAHTHALTESRHFESGDGHRYWSHTDRNTGERIYKKRNLATGVVTTITQEEYSQALSTLSTATANHQPKSLKPPKPPKSAPNLTEAERAQFIEKLYYYQYLNLTTKSDKDFPVEIRGNIETWESFFNEFPVSPSHIIKETLGSFVDAVSPNDTYAELFFKGHDVFLFRVRASKENEYSVYNNDKYPLLCRNFYFNRKDKSVSVSHEYFELGEDKQGKGLSKKIMSEALDLYESIGVSTVTLNAALEVGPYVWAKYGFVPAEQQDSEKLADDLSYVLYKHPDQFPPESKIHKDLSKYIEKLRTEPKTIRKIADYAKPLTDSKGNPVIDSNGKPLLDKTTGKPMKAGKALMLIDDGLAWEGAANLRDKSTVRLWKKYTKIGKNVTEETPA